MTDTQEKNLTRRQFLQSSAAVAAASLAAPLWAANNTASTEILAGDEPRVIGNGTSGPSIDRGATPAAIPPGKFQPTWDSLRANYKTPAWFTDSKFGIFIHWGLYTVPAYHNEWYARHMYGAFVQWHTEHFGPPDKFGYKNFAPMFLAQSFDPNSWAALFKKAGAKYVVPVGEHHDGFAMWDSSLTRWCAGKMGPKRDLIGDLSKAVKDHGLIFGVSSHRMEHHDFMYPTCKVPTDLFVPANADFYGPPVPGNMNDGNASQPFQNDWLARCQELIDKYQPQMLWFDNGVNSRNYDPVKLQCAAFYYNRAAKWGKEVTISTKSDAYLAGSILDFEKAVRGPKDILPGAWQIDDQIATNSWGYVTLPNGMNYRKPSSIIGELADTVSKGGNLLLNISPRSDGVIPDEQQQILATVGSWLETNGEAIYSSRPWKQYGQGPLRFTTKGNTLYVIDLGNHGQPITITPPASGGMAGNVQYVTLLGSSEKVIFSQDAAGLHLQAPQSAAGVYGPVYKVEGLQLA